MTSLKISSDLDIGPTLLATSTSSWVIGTESYFLGVAGLNVKIRARPMPSSDAGVNWRRDEVWMKART
ncbi:hypothetical protein D3C81_1768010 [compost metagenome]